MQKLAEICVHRPVFATMLIAAITVIGGVSFFTLGIDRYPRVETPVVSVNTSNPGATPEAIETEITDRIEAAVNTVAGIDELRSVSNEGSSRVTITFDLSKNPDIAAQEVRAKVDPVIRNLPETADPPVVQKQDPDSRPVILFSVSAPMPVVELTTFVEQNIQKRIESVNGVGEVMLYGARRRELHVKVDPDRLAAYGLSTSDVASALRSQNLELPGGRLEQGARDLSVRTVGRLTRPADFENVVVATRANSTIKVRDIGTVEDTGEPPSSVSLLNAKPAVSVAIRKQSGVNTVALAEAVKARMAEVQQTLPPNVEVRLIRDDSQFIEASLHAIEEHLVLGGLFAAIIVLVFLRNFRSTLIAALAIPTSIIGAFGVMAALGFTLNQMTMLALTLMVGIVIDDAIVVLENIYRFVEEKGMTPFQAAIEGTREIGLAVMATTLSLLAVFLPVGFLGGIVGRFMSSFGLTASAAIAISLIVSFTLTPMLAARWIKHTPGEKHDPDASRRGFYRHIDATYTWMLKWAMAHRIIVVGVCVLVVASIFPLYKMSGVNFTPDEDESRFQMSVRLPVGSSLAATQSLLDKLSNDVRSQLPGVADTLAIAGFGGGGGSGSANSGTMFVSLVPIGERELSQQELVVRARRLAQPYRSSAVVSVQGTSGLSFAGRGSAIQFALVGPNLQKLDEYTTRAVDTLGNTPELVDVDRSFEAGRPELRIDIDRQRAADLGVRVQDISQTVNALLAGQDVTTYNAASDQYDVVLKAQDSFRRTPESIAAATVRTGTGELVQLRNLVRFSEGAGPASIDRLNRQRQITVSANPAPGRSQAEGQLAVQQAFDALDMEPGYSLVTSGQSRELARAGYYFGIAFALSFVFMYMVLAAQFESFVHPITILLTLPLAVPFGLLASLLSGIPLNIYSALGVLLLFGIVKKNAILQIDHTIGLRAKGMPRDEAIVQANRDRLRPILMTTLALIAGMMPLVLGSGPGAETNRSIGILVVGGQALCLLLTLLAVPVFYSLFDDAPKLPVWGRFSRRRLREARGTTALLLMLALAVPAAAQQAPQEEVKPVLPPRIGVTAAPATLTLEDVIRMTLEANNDVAVARLETEAARQDIVAAEGVYDLRLTPLLAYDKAASPSASTLGGATEGRVDQDIFSGSLQATGRSPWGGSRFTVDFTSSRIETSNQFARLNPQFASALGATFVQPLLRGRTIDNERRQILLARRAADLNDAQLRQVLAEQLTLVEEAFWDLAFAVRNLEVQSSALEQALRQVQSNERQAQEGTLAPIDVVEAQIQVSNFRQTVASSQQALTQAENRLKALMLPDRSSPLWQQPLVPTGSVELTVPAVSVDEAVQRALERRPELAALESTRAQNQVDQAFFRDLARPQLDLVGSYSLAGLAGGALTTVTNPFGSSTDAAIFARLNELSLRAGLNELDPPTGNTTTVPPFLVGSYGSSLTNLFRARFPTAAVQLQLDLPLRNRTAEANVARSELVGTAIERQRQQLDQVIESEVRNALQAVQSGGQRLEAAASARRNATEQFESERRRFDSGLSTVFLVLERQTALVTAQARELRARADLNQAIAQLERAMGSTLDRHGVRLKP
jgi:HAE1 family hydrophobic/amphiphilic exporter-1